MAAPPPQVGNWRPYKGGKPPDPPPAGQGPLIGSPHPRFPTVGPTEIAPPAGGYQSIIDTAPMDQGKRNQITAVPVAFQSSRTSGGDPSRAAFARAVSDTSRNAMGRAENKFSTDLMQQSQKSRSEDLLAQKQSAADRFRMDLSKNIFDTDTTTRYSEGIKDGSQMFETEKRNEEAKRTAMVMRMIGGLL